MLKIDNNYIPTDEQNRYVAQEEGKIILNACPGSGKTSTIAYKLTKLIPKYERRNDYSGLACLSFTNVAKDEIKEKYKQFTGKNITFPHIVCTIDHFINEFITLPFFHKLNREYTRPKIIENANFLDGDNFTYLRSFRKKDGKTIFDVPQYKPSTIELKLDGYYSAGGRSPDPNNVDPAIFKAYCKKIKDWQLKNGLLKTSDSAFIAVKILEVFPQISYFLIQRFPHIIIDEAQDTSEIQHSIFDKLISAGLRNIEFIGDPYQSLYEWRDAKPEIFYQKINNGDYHKHYFTKCNRSSQNIVNAYCVLRKNEEKKLESTKKEGLPLHVYKYTEGKEREVVADWKKIVKDKYTDNCILVRGNSLKDSLLGVSTPSSSPWRFNIVPNNLIQSWQEFNAREIKKAVLTLRKLIPIIEGVQDYKIIKDREMQLRSDHSINGLIIEILKRLPSFELSLQEWTKQSEGLIKNYFSECTTDFGLKVGIWNKKHNLKMSDIFTKSENNLDMEVSTIHGVKGRTFDSVLLFLSKPYAQSISLDDIDKIVEFPNEKQRLIYVAMSRPSYLLALGIPNNYSDAQIKDKFGDQIIIKGI